VVVVGRFITVSGMAARLKVLAGAAGASTTALLERSEDRVDLKETMEEMAELLARVEVEVIEQMATLKTYRAKRAAAEAVARLIRRRINHMRLAGVARATYLAGLDTTKPVTAAHLVVAQARRQPQHAKGAVAAEVVPEAIQMAVRTARTGSRESSSIHTSFEDK
jgi:hypothetical protein